MFRMSENRQFDCVLINLRTYQKIDARASNQMHINSLDSEIICMTSRAQNISAAYQCMLMEVANMSVESICYIPFAHLTSNLFLALQLASDFWLIEIWVKWRKSEPHSLLPDSHYPFENGCLLALICSHIIFSTASVDLVSYWCGTGPLESCSPQQRACRRFLDRCSSPFRSHLERAVWLEKWISYVPLKVCSGSPLECCIRPKHSSLLWGGRLGLPSCRS